MDLNEAMKAFGMEKNYELAQEQLQELCDAKCNCGYILPKPDWPHAPDCAFQKAYEELISK